MAERSDLRDLLPPLDDFDAAQWAVHGLLSRHFDSDPADQVRRVESFISRWHSTCTRAGGSSVPVSSRGDGGTTLRTDAPAGSAARVRTAAFNRRTFQFRRWTIRVAALAAVFALAVTLVWTLSRPPAAAANPTALLAAVNAASTWFYFLGPTDLPLTDDDSRRNLEQIVAISRKRLDEDRAAIERTRDFANPAVIDLCFAWQSLYCALRDLGLRDDAVREGQAAVEYARNNPTGRPIEVWVPILLDGLANTYAAFGEFPAARATYLESIHLRRAAPRNPADPNSTRAGYDGDLVFALAPMYLRMVMLCLAENDPAEARRWYESAERIMRDSLATVCELDRIPLPTDPSLWEVWRALPAAYRNPKYTFEPQDLSASSAGQKLRPPDDTVSNWVRAISFHEARLLRAEDRLSEARAALDRTDSIPDRPATDELRLSFALPLEFARWALTTGDYPLALAKLDEARRAAAPIVVPADARSAKPAVGPTRLAEVDALQGIALIAFDANSQTGRALVERALQIPKHLADALPTDQRAAFLRHFDSWTTLLANSS